MTLLWRVLHVLRSKRTGPAAPEAAQVGGSRVSSPRGTDLAYAGVHVDLGRALLRAGRLAEATSHFHAAHKLDPDNFDALMALGQSAAIVWDVPSAIRWYRAALEHPAPAPAAALELAGIYLRSGMFDDADRLIARFVATGDESGPLRGFQWERGLLALVAGRREFGNEMLRACIEAGTGLRAIFPAAQLFCQQGMFDTAGAMLRDNRDFILGRMSNWSELAKYDWAIEQARDRHRADTERAQSQPGISLVGVRPLHHLAARVTGDLESCIGRPDTPLSHSFASGLGPSADHRPEDDLGGLLSEDVDALGREEVFRGSGASRRRHRLFVLPNARLSADADRMASVVIEPGLYVTDRMNDVDPVCFLDRVAMRHWDRKLASAFILPSWPRNFYHTLCCSMGTLAVYKRLNLDVPVVFPQAPNEMQRSILNAAGIPAERAVTAGELDTTLIETAFVPQSMPYHWNRTLIDFHRSIAPGLAARRPTIDAPAPERLYISRRAAERRRLENESVIEDVVRSFGFRVLRMEELSFEDQVAAVLDARIIIGPHGAGLTHMIFCRPGTRIVELMPDKIVKTDFCLRAHACGHTYYPVLGRMPPQPTSIDSRDVTWTLDPVRLARIVERLVA
jgi:tetratricopeptide (TPR) repeat protein